MPKFNSHKMMTDHCNRLKFIDVDPSVYSVYTIGDLHGCFDEMQEMVDKCILHSKQVDKTPCIIFLGDLIDRGPDFLSVFRFINEHNITCLLGNHELHFYLEAMGTKECRSKARKQNHITFQGLDTEDQGMIMECIGNMPNGIIINMKEPCDTGFSDFVLTHSPIRNVEYSIVEDAEFDVLHMMNGPQCNMRSETVNFEQLDRVFEGVMFVHGHQSWNFKPIPEQNEEQKGSSNRVINVDSGVVYGDVLTALCLNTNEYIEVQARKAYSERH